MKGSTESRFSFEEFTLDAASGSVRIGERVIELRPKSFEVLCCLLENAGRLVSKEELIKSVWANSGVTDELVAKCVSDIRLALDDSDQRFIKTVTRRGYVFVAPVSRYEGRETDRSRSSAQAISLIVLPFTNLSGKVAHDRLGGGITEGLTSYLSRISTNLAVACSPTVLDGQREADARQIGRALNASYLLAGSHQHVRERVRVSARLIDACTGAHLWTEQFDTDRTDMLDLQDIIVTRLARIIQIELAALEAARISQAKPTRADAEALARRGEAVFLKYGPNREEVVSGYELCERALAVDPSNARALSILAEKFATRITASQSDNRDSDFQRAEEFVSRALASEPNSYYAHHAKARLLVAQKRPEEALVEAWRALALNPSFIPAYQILCMVSLFTGRPDQIIEYADKAAQLSPADPFRYIFYAFKAYGYVMLDDKVAAIECLRQAVANNPNFPTPLAWLAALLALVGKSTEARDTLQRYLALSGAKTRTVAQWRATSWADSPAYLAFRDRLYEGLRIVGMPEE